jgi:hypothetical protein
MLYVGVKPIRLISNTIMGCARSVLIASAPSLVAENLGLKVHTANVIKRVVNLSVKVMSEKPEEMEFAPAIFVIMQAAQISDQMDLIDVVYTKRSVARISSQIGGSGRSVNSLHRRTKNT